ncbi:unnamed protein product [Caenorhabditis auriculariae]|uniref:Uncharacterized protein n=1 Tax=Caenorhabditis auriculariae TaxID=2777116 RepID=A0A8S1GPB3_9PELO|nr:unnamed protein product [Caenorhabditis auriculariae]
MSACWAGISVTIQAVIIREHPGRMEREVEPPALEMSLLHSSSPMASSLGPHNNKAQPLTNRCRLWLRLPSGHSS